MAKFPCINKADCICDPNPVTNFSSEAIDLNDFLGIQWNFPPRWIDGGTDPGPGNQPPCFCFSTVSQEDADLCAKRCSYPPGPPNPPPPGPPPPPNGFPNHPNPLFFNSEQTCNHTCPDGSIFIFRVAAGTYLSYNQDLSNQMALSLACKHANDLHICFIPPLDHVCLNDPYSSQISVPLATPPVTFTITSGSLPPGLFGNTSIDGTTFLIEGTADTAGTYPFTIMAVDTIGNTMIGNYTIRVLGITNITTLPNAVENTAYSTQLNAVGGTAPFTFELVTGSVPGITLSSTGLLSGTPDYVTAGTYPITVRVRNSEGDTCQFDGSIHISLRPGPDWTQLTWPTYTVNNGGAGSSASGANNANTGFANVTWVGTLPFPGVGPVASSVILYTGPAVTARMRLTVTFASNDGAGVEEAAQVLRNAVQIGGYGGSLGTGVHEFDIPIPLSAGASFQVTDLFPGNNWCELNQINTHGTLAITWAIFNV